MHSSESPENKIESSSPPPNDRLARAAQIATPLPPNFEDPLAPLLTATLAIAERHCAALGTPIEQLLEDLAARILSVARIHKILKAR